MKIRVEGSGQRVAVSPSLYGIFFEEINHAGDGGIYAELVQNRDFEANTAPDGASLSGSWLVTPKGWIERKWFNNELPGWRLIAEGGAKGSIRQDSAAPLNDSSPHSMRLTIRQPGRRLAVANDGYWGMNFRAGERYDLSFYARTDGDERHNLTVSLESRCGHEVYARATAAHIGGPWRQYRLTLQPDRSDPAGALVMEASKPGTLWFDVVSLFPANTHRSRPNGLRPDLVRMLADMKPAFLRFPGGCVVEGIMMSNRFQWKNSIGDIALRRGNFNLWGYYSSYGLGFHEYLQLCEDLDSDAMYVINAGMSCQARKAEFVAENELQSCVQDALDALEYAMGPVSSEWGGRRAANGHPEPFRIRYVEIGNENAGPEYQRNYPVFYEAIRSRYPEIVLIADCRDVGGAPIEMTDDHYYDRPDFFFDNVGKYDSTDRKGPAVYVGEYACNANVGQGNLLGALSEAAFMIGMERNSDVVKLCSYAPLFFNVNDISWPVNLIGFDSARVVGRTSYHVQRLFARNRPDEVMPTFVEDSGPKPDVFALAGLDVTAHEIVIKVVNRSGRKQPVELELEGLKLAGGRGRIITLSHKDPTAENSLDDPDVVVPVESGLDGGSPPIVELKPFSLTILRLPMPGHQSASESVRAGAECEGCK